MSNDFKTASDHKTPGDAAGTERPFVELLRKMFQEELKAMKPPRTVDLPVGFRIAHMMHPGEADEASAVLFEGHPKIQIARLLVPSEIASNFKIENILVNDVPAFKSASALHPIPGRTFQENAVAVRMQLDTPAPKTPITIRVHNCSAVPMFFYATLILTFNADEMTKQG